MCVCTYLEAAAAEGAASTQPQPARRRRSRPQRRAAVRMGLGWVDGDPGMFWFLSLCWGVGCVCRKGGLGRRPSVSIARTGVMPLQSDPRRAILLLATTTRARRRVVGRPRPSIGIRQEEEKRHSRSNRVGHRREENTPSLTRTAIEGAKFARRTRQMAMLMPPFFSSVWLAATRACWGTPIAMCGVDRSYRPKKGGQTKGFQ